MHEGGGNCLKYLRRGCNRKEGRGDKNLKKGGTSKVKGYMSLKSGGLKTPYELRVIKHANFQFHRVHPDGVISKT